MDALVLVPAPHGIPDRHTVLVSDRDLVARAGQPAAHPIGELIWTGRVVVRLVGDQLLVEHDQQAQAVEARRPQ